MNYARWETLEELKKDISLEGVDGKNIIEKSGIPVAYDENRIYIDSRSNHSFYTFF